MREVLVLIPAHNEEKNIGFIIDLIKKELSYADVLVVDDGSTDKTSEIAREKGVFVISHEVNLGVGAAFKTGIKFALRKHYKYVIQIDADGQHDPKYAHMLLDKLKRDKMDIVIGSRFKKRGRDEWYPLLRYIGVIFYSKLIRLITGYDISDATSGYLVMNRKAMNAFMFFYPKRHPAIPSLFFAYLVGLRVGEVPVRPKPRLSGKSMFTKPRLIMYHIENFFNILHAIRIAKVYKILKNQKQNY